MGILGLTDQGASFPFLGTIRKGGKKEKNAKGQEIQGKDLTYFRLDLGEKSSPELEKRWFAAFGQEPTQFSCLLLHEHPDQAFDAWYKEYAGNHVLTKKCDGEYQCQWLTEKNSYSFEPKPCQKNDTKPCQCTQSAELRVVIPDLGIMGFFKLLTHSKWDILSLSQQLNMVYLSAGRLTGIPFLVKRQPREIFANYQGKKNRVKKSLLSIEVHPDVAGRVLKIIEAKAFNVLESSTQSQITGSEFAAIPLLLTSGQVDSVDDDDEDDFVEAEVVATPTYTSGLSKAQKTVIANEFKFHYESLNVPKNKAVELMHSLDANAVGPWDLQPDELKECLKLIKQEAQKMQKLADEAKAIAQEFDRETVDAETPSMSELQDSLV